MIKLELELGNGTRINKGEFKTISNAINGITDYLNYIKYKSYYHRYSMIKNEETGENEIWIDFGSHTQFFYINGFTDKEYKEWIGRSSIK